MPFVKFLPKEGPRFNNPMPRRMKVGQVAIRRCNDTYVMQLKSLMRRAMRNEGMQFSIYENKTKFVIRRDK